MEILILSCRTSFERAVERYRIAGAEAGKQLRELEEVTRQISLHTVLSCEQVWCNVMNLLHRPMTVEQVLAYLRSDEPMWAHGRAMMMGQRPCIVDEFSQFSSFRRKDKGR